MVFKKPLHICSFVSNLNPEFSVLVAQKVKRLPAMQETWVWFLGQEDPLEKGMATHSSILAWKIHGLKSLVGYSPWGHKEWDTAECFTSLHFSVPIFFSILHCSQKHSECWQGRISGNNIHYCLYFFLVTAAMKLKDTCSLEEKL